MAVARLPGAEDNYEELLKSTSPEIRKLALRGLATLATPRAAQILREFHDQCSDQDMKRLTRRIMKHPVRYGYVSRAPRN